MFNLFKSQYKMSADFSLLMNYQRNTKLQYFRALICGGFCQCDQQQRGGVSHVISVEADA